MTKDEIEKLYNKVPEPKASFNAVWEYMNGPEDYDVKEETGVSTVENNYYASVSKLINISNQLRPGTYGDNSNEYEIAQQLKGYSERHKKYGYPVPKELIDEGKMDWQGNIL